MIPFLISTLSHKHPPVYLENGLPSSGTAKFTTTVNVRSAPSTSSSVVAVYNPGETVKYDKVVQGDGRTWISYIGGSGKRRYCCAIDKGGKKYVTTSDTPSPKPTSKPTPKPSKGTKTISKHGLDFIASFEGCSLTAYWDSLGSVWTIGYGHTGGVHKGQVITKQKALDLLKSDCSGAASAVNRLVKVAINQNQFDALVSFTFNCGSGALQSSTLLKLLNAGDYKGAANEFPKWNHAGGKVVAGLTRRRNAEKKLFLS